MRKKLVSINRRIADRDKSSAKLSQPPARILQTELLDLIAEIIAHDLLGQGERQPKEICRE